MPPDLDPLAVRVAARVKERGLLGRGDRVLAAVSGGADSLALLHILWVLREELGLEALGVASLDHGLRGPAGAADVAYVGEVASRLDLPFFPGRLEPGSLEAARGVSPEEAARRARYAFLGEVARQWGRGRDTPVRVATGHTADDQAETVLLRIIEGTGLRGLAGIPARRQECGWTLVRPLLGVRRAETAAYCRRWNLSPRIDETNDDPRYRRNFVRTRVVPLLEEINPRVVEALVRLAELASRQAEHPGRAALEAELAGLVQRGPAPPGESPRLARPRDGDDAAGRRDLVFLPKAVLTSVGDRLGPALIRAAVAAAAGETALRDLGFEGARRAARAAASLPVGSRLSLPGRTELEVGYHYVFLAEALPEPSSRAGPPVGAGGLRVTLAPEGTTDVPHLGWRFHLEPWAPGCSSGPRGGPRDPAAGGRASSGPDRMTVDLDPASLSLPLAVRTRRPGDVFRPAGSGPPGVGTPRRLKGFFIAAKVPRAQRERWPLVVDAADRIVWVTGLRADERFIAREPGRPTLRISAERLGAL